jgi:hypothetical protein
MNNPSDAGSFEAVVPADEHGSSCLPVVAQAAVPAEKDLAALRKDFADLIKEARWQKRVSHNLRDNWERYWESQEAALVKLSETVERALTARSFGGNERLSDRPE